MRLVIMLVRARVCLRREAGCCVAHFSEGAPISAARAVSRRIFGDVS